MKFVRYGNLIPQYHELDNRSFHTAPVEMGFYAFPKNYEEPFLLSGIGSGAVTNGRYKFLRTLSGKKVYASLSELCTYDIEEKWGCARPVNAELKPEWKDILPNKIEYADIIPYRIDGDCRIENIGIFEQEFDEKFYWVIEQPKKEFEYKGLIWSHLVDEIKPNEILKRSGSWVLSEMKTYQKALKKTLNVTRYNHGIKRPGGRPLGYPLDYISKDWLEVFIEKLS